MLLTRSKKSFHRYCRLFLPAGFLIVIRYEKPRSCAGSSEGKNPHYYGYRKVIEAYITNPCRNLGPLLVCFTKIYLNSLNDHSWYFSPVGRRSSHKYGYQTVDDPWLIVSPRKATYRGEYQWYFIRSGQKCCGNKV